jgi:hypothetical protein
MPNNNHNNHPHVDCVRVARNNIDIAFLIMKQRLELWNNGSELWHNDINIDIA